MGIFNPDGKTLNRIDQPGEFNIATLIDQDTLSITLMDPETKYAEPRDPIAISMTLHRQNTTAQ